MATEKVPLHYRDGNCTWYGLPLVMVIRKNEKKIQVSRTIVQRRFHRTAVKEARIAVQLPLCAPYNLGGVPAPRRPMEALLVFPVFS